MDIPGIVVQRVEPAVVLHEPVVVPPATVRCCAGAPRQLLKTSGGVRCPRPFPGRGACLKTLSWQGFGSTFKHEVLGLTRVVPKAMCNTTSGANAKFPFEIKAADCQKTAD